MSWHGDLEQLARPGCIAALFLILFLSPPAAPEPVACGHPFCRSCFFRVRYPAFRRSVTSALFDIPLSCSEVFIRVVIDRLRSWAHHATMRILHDVISSRH